MFKRIKQLFCKHKFKRLDDEICIGETLSWAFKPTKEFESTYRCLNCGKEEKRRYIYFGGIYDEKVEG